MSALRSMAAILAGVGTGMVSNKEEAEKKARQDKQDAWLEEQRTRQRQEWQDADKLKSDIKDASAVRQTMTGTVTESGGQKLFNADPGQAAQIKSMAESIAELEGGAPVTQAPGYAVTGQMARGHQIGTGAAPGVAALNTPDAESQRVQDVYRRAGLRDKAMTEFTANENYKTAIETRKKTMETEGATKALGLLRSGSPEQAMEAFQSSGSVKLPVGSKFVQLDGIDMHTGKPGKVWGAVGPDGKTIVADVGKYVAQYLGIADQFKFDGEAAKNAQAQANADRTYKLEEQKTAAQSDYYRAAAGAKEKPATSTYERMDEIDRKTFDGLQKQIDTIDKAILDAKMGGMANPEAIKEYEARLGAFRIQQRQLAAKYQTATQAPDPQGLRSPTPARSTPTGPTNTSERQMARDVQGGMGADPAAIRREIAASKANLAQVPDEASRKMLTDYISSLEQQLARIGTPPAAAKTAPAAPVTRVQAAAAPKPSAPNAPTKSMGEFLSGMFSGNAQINGIKDKLARGLPLSGTETVIARENKLIASR